jgi:hypothetical protein
VRDEEVDEGLRQAPVDLRGVLRRALAPVVARVVDVGVEPVLMAGVSDRAEAHAEVAAVRPAQVTDQHAGSVGMRRAELARDVEQGPHQAIGAPAAPWAVGAPPEHRVPGEEARAPRRQLHAALETAR